MLILLRILPPSIYHRLYRWGKFGVISETDIYSKAEEYNSWLLDVKGLNREILTNREEKEHFRFGERFSIEFFDVFGYGKCSFSFYLVRSRAQAIHGRLQHGHISVKKVL